MKKIFFIIVLVFIFYPYSSAQKHRAYNEKFLFISAGPAYFLGDTGGYENPFLGIDDISLSNVRYQLSVGFGQLFNDRIGYKIALQYGSYTGKDGEKYPRQYAFNSSILQANIEAQIVFLRGALGNSAFYRLYAFAGGAAAYGMIERTGNLVNPTDPGNLTDFAIAIPLGIGFDVKVSRKITLGTELRSQLFLSDNMEGLSPQSSKSNDMTAAWLFTFAYTIFDKDSRIYRNWSRNCMCE